MNDHNARITMLERQLKTQRRLTLCSLASLGLIALMGAKDSAPQSLTGTELRLVDKKGHQYAHIGMDNLSDPYLSMGSYRFDYDNPNRSNLRRNHPFIAIGLTKSGASIELGNERYFDDGTDAKSSVVLAARAPGESPVIGLATRHKLDTRSLTMETPQTRSGAIRWYKGTRAAKPIREYGYLHWNESPEKGGHEIK